MRVAGIGGPESARHEACSHACTSCRGSMGRSNAKRRAAVVVEYTFLLVALAVPTVMGCIAGGRILVREYVTLRDTILMPYP